MSELTVGSISGLAANNYVVDVAAGSQLTQPGMILQVLQTVKSDVFITTSVTRSDIPGFSASITPSSSSSKILVMVDMKVGSEQGLNAAIWVLQRDGSDIYIGDSNGALGRYGGFPAAADKYVITSENAIYLDSPNSTSPVTYKIQMATNSAGQAAVLNRDKNNSYVVTASSITLMEIAQ